MLSELMTMLFMSFLAGIVMMMIISVVELLLQSSSLTFTTVVSQNFFFFLGCFLILVVGLIVLVTLDNRGSSLITILLGVIFLITLYALKAYLYKHYDLEFGIPWLMISVDIVLMSVIVWVFSYYLGEFGKAFKN